MPIIKSAIKQMKQNRVNRARNRHYSSNMKSMIKLFLEYVKKGDTDNANTIFPKAVSAIDTAAKKNIIHKHNAAHKKSRIQKALSGIDKTSKPKAEKKAEKKVEKKKEVKKTTKKDE